MTSARQPRTRASAVGAALVSCAVALSLVSCASQQASPAPYSSPSTLPGGAVTSSAITVAAVEPDNGVKPVVDFINSATSSIDIAIYQFDPTYTPLVDALLAAQRKGVKVRILLSRQIFGPDNQRENIVNRAKFRKLGLDAELSRPEFSYSHEKTIIADSGGADPRALICDFNFEPGYFGRGTITKTDFAGHGQTRGLAVLNTDDQDVARISETFNADWPPYSTWPAATRPNLVWSPAGEQFDPRENAITALTSLIEGSQESLDIYAMMFTLPSVLYEPILARARAGVRVRIASNRDGVTPEAARAFKEAGVSVVYGPKSTDGSEKVMFIHSKSIIVDHGRPSAVAFVGSQNPFLAESLDTERELGAFVTDPASIAKIRATFDRDVSSAQP